MEFLAERQKDNFNLSREYPGFRKDRVARFVISNNFEDFVLEALDKLN